MVFYFSFLLLPALHTSGFWTSVHPVAGTGLEPLSIKALEAAAEGAWGPDGLR